MKTEIYNLEYIKTVDELFMLVAENGLDNFSEEQLKDMKIFAKGYLLAKQNDDVNILFTFEDYITYYFKKISQKQLLIIHNKFAKLITKTIA